MKLVVDEDETDALKDELDRVSDRTVVASWLLHTELHCAAGRRPEEIPVDGLTAIFDRVELTDLTREDLLAASRNAPLRSNDAIHLAAAARLGVDEIITYDAELADAARLAGIVVLSPA